MTEQSTLAGEMGFGSSLGSFDPCSDANDEWYGGDRFVLGEEGEGWGVRRFAFRDSLLIP